MWPGNYYWTSGFYQRHSWNFGKKFCRIYLPQKNYYKIPSLKKYGAKNVATHFLDFAVFRILNFFLSKFKERIFGDTGKIFDKIYYIKFLLWKRVYNKCWPNLFYMKIRWAIPWCNKCSTIFSNYLWYTVHYPKLSHPNGSHFFSIFLFCFIIVKKLYLLG